MMFIDNVNWQVLRRPTTSLKKLAPLKRSFWFWKRLKGHMRFGFIVTIALTCAPWTSFSHHFKQERQKRQINFPFISSYMARLCKLCLYTMYRDHVTELLEKKQLTHFLDLTIDVPADGLSIGISVHYNLLLRQFRSM